MQTSTQIRRSDEDFEIEQYMLSFKDPFKALRQRIVLLK
jgi:hypothetical protein